MNANATLPEEQKFVEALRQSADTGQPAEAKLRTDDRVLARITDGIYRQPSSAIRELISNGYDADATEVYVETDAPRFERIVIRDNGNGMDERQLGRLIYHIGGSAKRTVEGIALGTNNAKDPGLTPAGRHLIGKIGIGLFSVSQLTSRFQIITKQKGSPHRLVAEVILHQYTEDEEPADGSFDSGSVRSYSVAAEDRDSHGTEIILDSLKPRARELLTSAERWRLLREQAALPKADRDKSLEKPAWHLGYIPENAGDDPELAVFAEPPCIPWEGSDAADVRFRKLFDAVTAAYSDGGRPDIAHLFDNYLSMIWTLGLSCPVAYIDKHPFEITAADNVGVFQLTQSGRGRLTETTLPAGKTVREVLGLKTRTEDPLGGFEVYVDGVRLRRPVSIKWVPAARQPLGRPLLFAGRWAPDLSRIDPRMKGGELEFEAYLLWNSRIVPKENNGVLVRIKDASGALFDSGFMRYEISEQTRLRQITSEIFVERGVDAALNIDRESFNYAHPHYILMSRWLHRAIRQLTNTHKALGKERRTTVQSAHTSALVARIEGAARAVWERERDEDGAEFPVVEIVDGPEAAQVRRKEGILALDRAIIEGAASADPTAKLAWESRARAIASILDAHGLLEEMPYEHQQQLIKDIIGVLMDGEDA